MPNPQKPKNAFDLEREKKEADNAKAGEKIAKANEHEHKRVSQIFQKLNVEWKPEKLSPPDVGGATPWRPK